MLVEAILATPFAVVGLVFDNLYHKRTGRPMFADRLLEGAVSGAASTARRVWHADKAPYARPIVALVKLAFHRQHETYRIAWTASKTTLMYHTLVTRFSRRAAVRSLRRQPWVRKAGRFMLLQVTIVPHEPVALNADAIPTTVEAPKPKRAKAATKRKPTSRKRTTRKKTPKRKATR